MKMPFWILVAYAFFGMFFPADAAAQCSSACVSSSSCAGTGRSDCEATCKYVEERLVCGCMDSPCSGGGDHDVISLAGLDSVREVRLVSDCSGMVLGAELVALDGEPLEAGPVRITFGRAAEAAPAPRFAGIRTSSELGGGR